MPQDIIAAEVHKGQNMSKKRRNNPYQTLKGLTSLPRRWCPSSTPPTTCPRPPPCSPRQRIPNQLENCWRTSQNPRLCRRDRSCGGRTGPAQGPPSWCSTTHDWPWPCCQLNCNELHMYKFKIWSYLLEAHFGKEGRRNDHQSTCCSQTMPPRSPCWSSQLSQKARTYWRRCASPQVDEPGELRAPLKPRARASSP